MSVKRCISIKLEMAFPLPPKEAAVYETNVVQKMCPNSFSGHKIDFFRCKKEERLSGFHRRDALYGGLGRNGAAGPGLDDASLRII